MLLMTPGQVCATYGDPHFDVTPRINKTLLRALLDTQKPLGTHYGESALVVLVVFHTPCPDQSP